MILEEHLSREEQGYIRQIKNYKKRSGEEKISIKVVRLIALSGFAAACFAMPGLTMTHKLFASNDERYCRNIYATVRRLREKGLIEQVEDKYYLTHKGRLYLSQENLKNFTFKKTLKIEKGYFLISFDIPEKKKYSRILLRKILLENNFKMLQQSVYVSKYDSKKEMLVLAKKLEIREHVVVGLFQEFTK